jgi:hypothetical protein
MIGELFAELLYINIWGFLNNIYTIYKVICVYFFLIILNFYIFLDFLNLEIIEFMLQVKKIY